MSALEVARTATAVVMTLNRPNKHNALNPELSHDLGKALDELDDTELPLVFRSGTPGMFVAGTDISSLKTRTTAESLSRLNAHLFQRIREYPWATVAVVDGPALGGGCELALACDIRVTTLRATWGLPEVRLGLVPSAGALTRLAQVVGEGVATDLILTGRRIGGTEAHRVGLAQHLTTADELDQTVNGVLSEIAEAAPHALRLAKEAMQVTGDRHRLVDAAAQALCLNSPETQQRLENVLGGHGETIADRNDYI